MELMEVVRHGGVKVGVLLDHPWEVRRTETNGVQEAGVVEVRVKLSKSSRKRRYRGNVEVSGQRNL